MEVTEKAKTFEKPENSQYFQINEKLFDNSLNILHHSQGSQIQNNLATQNKTKNDTENTESKLGDIKGKVKKVKNFSQNMQHSEGQKNDGISLTESLNIDKQKQTKIIYKDQSMEENTSVDNKNNTYNNEGNEFGHNKETTVNSTKNIPKLTDNLVGKENSHKDNQIVEDAKIIKKHHGTNEYKSVNNTHGNIEIKHISSQEQTSLAHKINNKENKNIDNQVVKESNTIERDSQRNNSSRNTEKDVDTVKDINKSANSSVGLFSSSSTNLSNSPFKVPFSPNKATNSPFTKKRSPLTFLDINSPFDIGRESLGILPKGALESVAGNLFDLSCGDPYANHMDFGNTSTRESLGIINLSARESLGFLNVSTRDSLGVLNESTLNDLGRESIGIFDIKNSFRRKPFTDAKENKDSDLAFAFPEITVATIDDPTSSRLTASLNAAFLMSRSKNLLSVGSENLSSMSANPSFHSGSLEEPSKIGSILNFFQKTQDFASSNLGITDPFNDALQGSEAFNDKEFTNSFGTNATKGVFSSTLGFVRDRIHSLPVTLEEKTFVFMASDKLVNKKIYDDSVFVEAKKVAREIADQVDPNESINANTSNEKNFLDATPQPEWPEDPNESKLGESFEEKIDKETISKKVDKMFAMLPAVDDKIQIKRQRSCGSTSSETSENISRISRTSQGTNKSQNISRVSRNTRTSNDDESRLISDLSQIIQDNHELPDFFKQESEKMLIYINNVLQSTEKSNESRVSNNEVDSGHSSVDEQQIQDQKKVTGEKSLNAIGKSGTDSPSPEEGVIRRNEQMERLLMSKSSKNFGVSSPTSSRIAVIKTPNTSVASNSSNGSSSSRQSFASINRSAVAGYSLAAGSQRAPGVRSSANKRSGPLKAVIPIENMTKNNAAPDFIQPIIKPVSCTPPKRQIDGLRSKKTSTPIQEPKLKPMAASTPASLDGPINEEKTHMISPMLRSRYSTRPSMKDNSMELPNAKTDTISKNTTTGSLTKYSTTLKRRSSLSEVKAIKPATFAKQNSSPETDKITCEGTNRSKITKNNNINTKRSTISEENAVTKSMVSQEKLSEISSLTSCRNSVSEVTKMLRQNTEEKINKPNSFIVRRNLVSGGQNNILRQNTEDKKKIPIERRNSISEGPNKFSRQNTEDKIKIPIVRRNSVSEVPNKVSRQNNEHKIKIPIGRRNSLSEGQSKVAVNKAVLSRLEKERRSPVMETKKSDAEGAFSRSPRSRRTFSTGSRDSKLMLALNKVRQSIRSSPYYNAKTSDSRKLVLGEQNQDRNAALEQKNYLTSTEKLGKENFKA